MTSHLVDQVQCPECAKNGKDTSKDNLGIYSDGHQYCYSCGYFVPAAGITVFKQKDVKPLKEQIYLPEDCDINYPIRALDWVAKYDLSRADLLHYNVMWSEKLQRLIFPVWGDGTLLAWQGRSFNLQHSALTPIPKWYGKGDLKNTFNIIGKGNTLVLVEDIISAIKIAKAGFMAMPLYGSFVGRQRFKRLYSLYGNLVEVMVWLDPDKRTEALSEAKLGRVCGLSCGIIYSDVDPKEESFDKIKELVKG